MLPRLRKKTSAKWWRSGNSCQKQGGLCLKCVQKSFLGVCACCLPLRCARRNFVFFFVFVLRGRSEIPSYRFEVLSVTF